MRIDKCLLSWNLVQTQLVDLTEVNQRESRITWHHRIYLSAASHTRRLTTA